MIKVIYQDESILVVDKPAGLSVLPDGWELDSNYLVRMLELDYSRIWVVHRLDKVTSGVMVFALNAEAHRNLNNQFETHQTGKTYHALCNGIPKWEQHTARHPLRINVGHSHRTVVDHAKGKPSVTSFTVLEKLGDAALLEAKPATGRTHQVRVHAYALGHPLLGDTLYSAPPTDLIGRPALHALSLTINHPKSGKPVKFEALYPEDFKFALDKLREG
jgi:23S rRNA pseudouridine955/2504/2580 synthase/23S rRNA pseudouridine1911/1915/1917 synthase